MLESIIKDFVSSSVAGEAVSALKSQVGLDDLQAQNAVAATAHGAADAVSEGGIAGAVGGLFGGGGLGGFASGLFGGSGDASSGGGMLGSLLGGGGGGGGGAPAGLPPAVVDKVVMLVAEKTGLGADKARMAVNVILPRVIDFVKQKMAS